MPNPWDDDPIVSPSSSEPGLRQIVPPTLPPPANYEPDPNKPGAVRPIEGGPADPNAQIPKAGETTDTQRMASGFYQRALYANSKYGKGVDPRSALGQTMVDILPENWQNTFTSDERQQANSYASDFIAATLRKESGAAIPPEELAQQYKRYFPMPGDSEDTLKVKARLRDTAISSLREQAGNEATSADAKVQALLEQDKNDPGAKYRQPAGDIGFNYEPDPRGDPLSDTQRAAYDAWWKANPHPTQDQLETFYSSLTGGGKITNAKEIIDSVNKGAGAAPGSSAQYEVPDISDARGANGAGEKADAFARGAGDAGSVGLADELAAVGDTIFKGGTFTDNLARQRAIDAYDRENHFWLRTGGQVVGGSRLPLFGARTPEQLAKVAAGYGAFYGAASSENLADIPKNAITGAATGALTAWGGSKLLEKLAARKAGKEIPDLVDGNGRLNEPLEAAGPAARVAAAKDYGIDLPMGAAGDRTAAVIEKKLDVRPASAGVMNDARRVVEDQVSNAAEDVASRFGSARSLYEAGTNAQNGAKSWVSRFEDTSRKAYDAIPISPQAQSSLTNTQQALGELTTIFESNPKLAETFKNTKLNNYLEALSPEQGGSLSWADLKAFRSRIGEEIGEQRFSDSPMKSELRRLYAAMSEDMRTTAAAQGPEALRKFERANNLYKAGQDRIDNALTRILGDDSKLNPEAAGAMLQTISRSGRGSGNLQQLGQIRASLVKSGDWNEVASSLIRLGGQPARSEGRSFDPGTFVRWYSDMTEPARNLLFGGPNKELRQALDGFVAVNQRLANSNALRNTSNTATASPTGTLSIPAAVAALFTGHPGIAGGLVVGSGLKTTAEYSLARMWTNPKFVQWWTGFTKMAAGAEKAGNGLDPAKVQTQVRLLDRLATADPAIAQDALRLRTLILGANDNYTRAAASGNSRREQQQ